MQGDRLSLLRVGVASAVLVTLTWIAVYVVRLNGWTAVGAFGVIAFPLVAWACCLPRPVLAQYWWNALVGAVVVPIVIAVQHVQTSELDRISIFLLLAIAMSLPALVGIAVGGLVVRQLERRQSR
jgi:hypothetical protein